jgi:hypothetical protein
VEPDSLKCYKSIGDEAGVRAEEDGMIRPWPNSQGTMQIVQKRLDDEHPVPKPGASKEAKDRYAATQYAFAEEMLKRLPRQSAAAHEAISEASGSAGSLTGSATNRNPELPGSTCERSTIEAAIHRSNFEPRRHTSNTA